MGLYKSSKASIIYVKDLSDYTFELSIKDVNPMVGADGSARLFDLRNLQHSTIVYEDPLRSPLMRLAWNKQENHYLATFAQDSAEVP